MKVDLRTFFRACDPSNTLKVQSAEDRKYYINFSSVRGGAIIEELGQTIDLLSPDPTCQLFAGHIGCGKSTELWRLKRYLEKKGFYVVYFDSSQDLDKGDVDVSDILLAFARQTSECLRKIGIQFETGYLTKLIEESTELLTTPKKLEVTQARRYEQLSVIAETQEGEGSSIRTWLRQYLEPQTDILLESINKELLEPGIRQLRESGKEGLVVILDSIIDNVDRLDNSPKKSGNTLAEHLFVYRGNELRGLNCHVVYTIPLVLMFSNEREALTNRLGGGMSPIILPMVPVKLPNGEDCIEGLELLRQMVLARAFPDLSPKDRLNSISAVFDSPETLDRLCRASGGHVRNLLRLLFACLRKQKTLPIARHRLDLAIREYRDELTLAISDKEWELIRQVAKTKTVKGKGEYQTLLRSLFVFGYRTAKQGQWFDVNPVLTEAKEFFERGASLKNSEDRQQEELQEQTDDYIDAKIIAGLDRLNVVYEEYLNKKDYAKAAETAKSAYEMIQQIANALDPKTQKEVYQRTMALASFWKLSMDLYRGLA